jgi:hypothetical protein
MYAEVLCRPASSTLSDSEDDETLEDVQEESSRKYAFPELDAKIRQTIKEYGAVFPKLNFSSPKVYISFSLS